MTQPRYAKTRCRTCRFRGPRISIGLRLRRSCLRHRKDGQPHPLPKEWVQGLRDGDEHCELYRPEEES